MGVGAPGNASNRAMTDTAAVFHQLPAGLRSLAWMRRLCVTGLLAAAVLSRSAMQGD